jgi:hypothetical protein
MLTKFEGAAMKKKVASYLIAVALMTVAGVLAGCGSGGSTVAGGSSLAVDRSAVGSATINIQWPVRTPTRLIPVASNNIIISITQNGKAVLTQVVPRPATPPFTSQATFPALPVGQLGVTAMAVPDATVDPANPTAHSNPQATGTGVISIQSGKTTTLNITMGTTIKSLQIVPPNPVFLQIGQATQLDVEALDANGSMVLISSATVSWNTDNVGFPVATATQNANATSVTVTGNSSGNTNLNVFESESGLSATLPVAVRGPLATISITSIRPNMTRGGVMQFLVVGTDASGNIIPGANLPPVTWASSDSQVANINAANGLCIAPQGGSGGGGAAATCLIIATSGTFRSPSNLTVNPSVGQLGGALLSPTSVTLNRGTRQQFLVYAGQNQVPGVVWSVDDPNNLGAALGTISRNGLYTAPATQPLFNGLPASIIVREVSNGSSQTATVTVP